MKKSLSIETKQAGSYDVIVCGGGTAGVIAAIAAARSGAKTLMLERTFTPGGMLTLGEAGITKFTEHCRDVDIYKREVLDALAIEPEKVQVAGGIPKELVDRMIADGGALGTSGQAGSYVFTDRCAVEWTILDMLREAGVEVIYGVMVCLAVMDGNRITGVVACCKDGFVQYDAARVIDATGDADVAALAGAPFHKGVSEIDLVEGCGTEIGEMQHAGTMFRIRGVNWERLFSYLEENPDRFRVHNYGVMSLENAKNSYFSGEMSVFVLLVDTPEKKRYGVQFYNVPAKDEAILLGPYCGAYIDGLNAESISRGQEALRSGVRQLMEIMNQYPGLEEAKACFIPDIGVRETRHIIGDYVITGKDVLSGIDFDDSVACGGHPVDIRPIPPDVENYPMNHWRFHIPYRVMLPKDVENLLVTGRPVSATRMASGCIRPTVQCMALGEAAGVAAALSIKQKVTPRALDILLLRKTLKDNGVLF